MHVCNIYVFIFIFISYIEWRVELRYSHPVEFSPRDYIVYHKCENRFHHLCLSARLSVRLIACLSVCLSVNRFVRYSIVTQRYIFQIARLIRQRFSNWPIHSSALCFMEWNSSYIHMYSVWCCVLATWRKLNAYILVQNNLKNTKSILKLLWDLLNIYKYF